MSLRQDPPKPHAPFCIQLVGTFAILFAEYVLLLSLAALSLAPLRAPLPFSPACPEVFAKGHKAPITSHPSPVTQISWREGIPMAALTLSEKLDQLDARYQEMSQELAKQHSDLETIVNKHREFKQIEKDLAATRQMVVESGDAEMRHMAQEEEKLLTVRKEQTERELKLLLLPHDPIDDKNIILEIRAGTGGDEAGIFAGDLFRMYSRYAESQGWKVEVMESSPAQMGGVKEIVAAIQGKKVYSKLKYESGVHRVQRVPATETQGRIHTSAATVAVLPE